MQVDATQLQARAVSGRGPAHLSATDTTFLLQERGAAHMHIGGISIFAGPPPEPEEFTGHIAERLSLVPRFRQKLARSPLPLDRPWWVEDPDFNLDYHVRRSALPRPGDDEQLKALVGRVFSQRLDRSKPLWEMYLVEGLQGGRFALITKAHHALVDGISGVDLASVLLDSAPRPAGGEAEMTPSVPESGLSRAQLLAHSMSEAARLPLALAQQAANAAADPGQVARSLLRASGAVGALGWEFANPAPRVPLNATIGPHRRYEFRHLPFADFHAVKTAHEATINDVVLTVATGALREWLRHRAVRTEGLALRALVPVNLRSAEERGLFGNRVALLRATLPVYASRPEQQLAIIREQMRLLKRSHQLMAAKAIIGLSEFAPPTILAQASRLNFSTRLFNLIVTNVPGPQQPLYLLGRQLQSIAPIAFLPSGHALSIAVFSYNGQISFGLLGDYDRMVDLSSLAGGIEQTLAALAPAAPARGDAAGPGLDVAAR